MLCSLEANRLAELRALEELYARQVHLKRQMELQRLERQMQDLVRLKAAGLRLPAAAKCEACDLFAPARVLYASYCFQVWTIWIPSRSGEEAILCPSMS